MPDNDFRCHWVVPEEGDPVLIPGCWNRVHDALAVCMCGKWSAETAAAEINRVRNALIRQQSYIQTLRRLLQQHGIPEPVGMPSPIRTPRLRDLHRSITSIMDNTDA